MRTSEGEEEKYRVKVISSRLFSEIEIKNVISLKRASRVCVASGVLRESDQAFELVVKMYLKEEIVNYKHILNERDVLEYIRDSDRISVEEKRCFPHLHDTLVLQDEKTKQVYICLALKYIHGFTLDKYLNVNTVSIDLFRNILIQIIKSLGILHRENIIHRDLKCNNIVLESKTDCNVVLIDMSLSKFLSNKDQRLEEFCGSFHSMAPEMLCVEKPNYGLGYDWWSLGVLVYEILFGVPPFGYHPEENRYLLRRIKESPKSLIFSEIVLKETSYNDVDSIKNFISGLLEAEEKVRLGYERDYVQVLDHEWLKSSCCD